MNKLNIHSMAKTQNLEENDGLTFTIATNMYSTEFFSQSANQGGSRILPIWTLTGLVVFRHYQGSV